MKPLSKQNTVDLIFLNGLASIEDKICQPGSRSRTEFLFRLVLLFLSFVFLICSDDCLAKK